MTRTDADIVFTKAKPKFERRIDFPHFLDALAAISARLLVPRVAEKHVDVD